MEREERNLNGERKEESDEQPKFDCRRKENSPRRDSGLNLRITESERSSRISVNEVQGDDRNKHEHRTDHRIQHEFDRRINAPLAAPDSDQEIHRHKTEVPENVKKKQVKHNKDAEPA